MEFVTYESEAETEQSHWWFVGRRTLFGKVVRSLGLPMDAAIIDIGSSTGSNLRLLQQIGHTNIKGVDSSPVARDFCAQKGLAEVIPGDIRDLPFEDESVDLAFATDILEHVDQDDVGLKEIFRILKPGGHALLTVPAFESLWGIQDDISLHKRRYLKPGFSQLVKTAGFDVKRSFYFNYLLFPLIWVTRLILRILKPKIRAETDINSAFINKVLLKLFTADILSAEVVNPPCGVSILILGRKPNTDEDARSQ